MKQLLLLGPAGTFSHEASMELFPKADIVFAANFDALFSHLQKENLHALVPIENSLHGPVDEVIDLLSRCDAKIWKVFDMRIHYAFGALHPDRVNSIASHPQALAQCREYLHHHYPEAEHFPASSTAFAIDLALNDPEMGAIASVRAMRQQDLPVVAENIEGENNTTRFAIVALKDPFPTSEKKQMGILLHPKEDRAGLLHDLLTPFKVYDVNLTHIESRPTGKKLGDYNFFVDLVGTKEHARVQKAFEEIRRVAEIKILGEW